MRVVVTFDGACRLRQPTVLAGLHLPSAVRGGWETREGTTAQSRPARWAPSRGVTPQT